jgi:hypothetical protein
VVGILTALLTLTAVLGYTSAEDTSPLLAGGLGIAGGVVTIVNAVVPRWRARKARALVTPLEQPQTNEGVPLKPDHPSV